MEMLQKSSTIVRELNRQRDALTQMVYQLSDALERKSDTVEISKMIDEVTVYTDFLVKSQSMAMDDNVSEDPKSIVAFGECYLKHAKGIKRYYHLENFNRLTVETLQFYSDLMHEQLQSIEKTLDQMKRP